MDSKRALYKVLNKDSKVIWVIANSPTQAIDLAASPRPEQETHVKAHEAVAVFAQSPYINKTLQQLLDSNEVGEVDFNPLKTIWSWKYPFYVLEFKYHGPFISNQAAADYAVNSNISLDSRVLRM